VLAYVTGRKIWRWDPDPLRLGVPDTTATRFPPCVPCTPNWAVLRHGDQPEKKTMFLACRLSKSVKVIGADRHRSIGYLWLPVTDPQ